MIPRTPTYREVRPPLPVTINLDQAIARGNPPLRSANLRSLRSSQHPKI